MTNFTAKVYPDWVQKFRTKGTTVKKKGDAYYLYKRTSKRVPGKKYPQPVDTYIGVITPDGVVKSVKKKVDSSDLEIKEFGFSKVVWELCPASWKKSVGKDWENVLTAILVQASPYSYLTMERKINDDFDFHGNLGVKKTSLSRKIHEEFGVTLDDLKPLQGVFIAYFGKKKMISNLNDEQYALLDKTGVSLEVY